MKLVSRITFTAELEIPAGGAQGVVVAQAGRFGGPWLPGVTRSSTSSRTTAAGPARGERAASQSTEAKEWMSGGTTRRR
jgi:hypothetical protein